MKDIEDREHRQCFIDRSHDPQIYADLLQNFIEGKDSLGGSQAAGGQELEADYVRKALLNAPTESVIVTDLDGKILALDELAAKRLGESETEMIGLTMGRYLPPSIVKSRKQYGDEVILTGRPGSFQDERAGRFFDINIHPVFS